MRLLRDEVRESRLEGRCDAPAHATSEALRFPHWAVIDSLVTSHTMRTVLLSHTRQRVGRLHMLDSMYMLRLIVT